MIKVSVSKVKSDFSKYLNQAAYGKERVVITSRGKPKAILVSVEEMKRLEALEKALAPADDSSLSSQNQRLLKLLRAAPDDEKDAEWWADFERELAENRLSFREIGA
jgi:prevent-host-death family protein